VARLLGADLGRGERVISAQEIEVRMSAEQCRECAVDPAQAELYFCGDLEGYGWCVRKGDYLNVGLGRTDSHRLPEAVKSFWQWLLDHGRIPPGLMPRFKGHAYLLYGDSRRTLVGEHALLIGDAAGLAYDLSGEGIRPAIESGLLAAQAIHRSLVGGDSAALAEYAAQIARRFGRRPGSLRHEAKAGGWRKRLGRRLVSQAAFARHVILDRNFLHRHTAALASPPAGAAA
jgi:flavin-dependent dehydrogenase